jgi:hypothetical protein
MTKNIIKVYINNDGSVKSYDSSPLFGYTNYANRIVLVTPWNNENSRAIEVVFKKDTNQITPKRTMVTDVTETEIVDGVLWNVFVYDIVEPDINSIVATGANQVNTQFRWVQPVTTTENGDPVVYEVFRASTIIDIPLNGGLPFDPAELTVEEAQYLSNLISAIDGNKLTKFFETLPTSALTEDDIFVVRRGATNYKISIGQFRGLVLGVENEIARLESQFTNGILDDGEVAINQNLKTTDSPTFDSITINSKYLDVAAINALEDKYTVSGADATFIKLIEKGAANGIATLDNTGRLPVGQLPLNTVVFRGTFGDGVGDLPTVGVETGDFYICVSNGYVSAVAGLTFDNGDKAVYDGVGWSKIDNTETVTGVKGSEEVDFRIGNVSISKDDIGLSNVTNDTQVTSVSGSAPIASTGGTTPTISITAASQSAAGSMSAADKEKLDGIAESANNYSHPNHSGDVTSVADGDTTIATGAVTLAKMADLTAGTIIGNDELTDGVPKALTASEARTLLDVYDTTTVDDALAFKLSTSLKGTANGLAELDGAGKVPSSQLPSFVDDVLEYADLASFPVEGETGKIYVALDDGKTYRWSGTQYTEISPSEVNSVNGYTGVITLAGSDLAIEDVDIDIDASGFTGILTTDDTTLDVALDTIDAHTHAYEEITNKPLLYTQAELDSFLAEKADVSSLSASISLYPSTSPSEISGYFTMVTDIDDTRYNDVAFDVGTGAISTQNQLVASLATDPDVFVGNPGVINITTLGNIRKTSGNSSQYAEFYYQIFKRDAAGTETLLGTSDTTGAVNPENGNYREFSASAILNNGNFVATDRIVIKYYANALEGTVSEYDFQFGGASPVRTLLPVPVRVLQSADKIIYDNTTSGLTADNLQDAVDELDTLIAQNTSVIQVQRFVITNPDNGNGTFTYTYNGGGSINGTLAGGVYTFGLQNGVEYIVGQNRVEVKVNNDITYYAPDAEMTEVDSNTITINYPFQANDEIFFKVYEGLDSVALDVPDGSITTLKLSTGIQQDLASYETHIGLTNNPHGVTAGQVGLGNLTNDTQVKKAVSSTDGYVPVWSGTAGDAIVDGYGVQTTLSSSTTDLVRADAIETAIGAKQDTLESGVNIKTLNGSSILGSGDYVIDIPSVDIASTAPENPNVGDLWWNDTDAVLYIYYNDGTSSQWVSVSYADVEAAIESLVGTAPETLDTLQEIAAALQDNPDFYTTLTDLIGTKATTASIDLKADKLATFETISASHTLVLTDKDKVLECTNSSAIDITIPTEASINFPVGTQIAVLRNGAGTVTFAGASGVTVNSKDSALAIAGQYASAALLKIDTDEWQLVGSLE